MHSLKQPTGQTALHICACGKLSLSHGQVTLHFEPGEFTSFASAVAQLFARYREMKQTHPHNSTPSLHNDLCH